MEERRKSKVSSQLLRTSIRETGTRETGTRETGTRETGTRETGTRETGIRETGTRETGTRETATRDTGIREADFGHKSISRLKMRRTSFGFASVPGIKPIDRTSQVGMEFRRPPLVYLNTYQLDSNKKFDIHQVELETNKILDNTFTDHKYNEQASPALAVRIAAEVMRKIKTLNFNRYRIITIVTIAQKRAQSYNNAISFLWDYERDGYVDLMREVNTAFIQITTFGIYLD